jgi:hypothetical protein
VSLLAEISVLHMPGLGKIMCLNIRECHLTVGTYLHLFHFLCRFTWFWCVKTRNDTDYITCHHSHHSSRSHSYCVYLLCPVCCILLHFVFSYQLPGLCSYELSFDCVCQHFSLTCGNGLKLSQMNFYDR